jgi:hypothetical protein
MQDFLAQIIILGGGLPGWGSPQASARGAGDYQYFCAAK